MKIICPNCGFEINLKDIPISYLSECPRCGAPIVGKDGMGVTWA